MSECPPNAFVITDTENNKGGFFQILVSAMLGALTATLGSPTPQICFTSTSTDHSDSLSCCYTEDLACSNDFDLQGLLNITENSC